MTISLLEREFPNDHLPLLRWLMFTGVSAFGFIIAWYYGLFHLMLASDKTYISAIIGVLYILATVHCFVRTAVISREMDSAQRVFSLVSRGVPDLRVVAGDVVTVNGALFYHATHIRPDWAPQRERVARIGRHVFYR